MVEGIK